MKFDKLASNSNQCSDVNMASNDIHCDSAYQNTPRNTALTSFLPGKYLQSLMLLFSYRFAEP
jgi:hypothetical protein